MALVEIEVPPADVVYVKGIVEASEGLANVFAAARGLRAAPSEAGRGARLTLAAPPERASELAEMARDIARELSLETRAG